MSAYPDLPAGSCTVHVEHRGAEMRLILARKLGGPPFYAATGSPASVVRPTFPEALLDALDAVADGAQGAMVRTVSGLAVARVERPA
jgi:hypothetical protein